jgi:hypothetical protein
MYSLKIYTDPVSINTPIGGGVFYCHRAGGPYYRWCDEKGLDQWHFTRLHPSDWTPKALCRSTMKAMPTALQASIYAHYMS